MTQIRSAENVKKITDLFFSHQVIDDFLTTEELEALFS